MHRYESRTAALPLLAWLLAAGSPILAQEEVREPAELRKGRVVVRSYTFEEAERDVQYALFVPTSYDPEKPAPLVVLLHGLGSNPRQVMGYQGITAEAEERGYIVVAPYGYNERGWYGSRGPGKDGPFFGRRGDPDNLGELSEQDVLNVLALVRGEFAVDPARTFLMGHSMGGAGTLYLGAKHRDQWAGLAPLAPAVGGSMDLLENLRRTPVFVVTGDRDRLVRVGLVRRWVEEMRRLEVPCRYEELEGGDHVVSIARNPTMIASVFEFFDGVRLGEPAAQPSDSTPAPEDSDGSDGTDRSEKDRTPSPRPRVAQRSQGALSGPSAGRR